MKNNKKEIKQSLLTDLEKQRLLSGYNREVLFKEVEERLQREREEYLSNKGKILNDINVKVLISMEFAQVAIDEMELANKIVSESKFLVKIKKDYANYVRIAKDLQKLREDFNKFINGYVSAIEDEQQDIFYAEADTRFNIIQYCEYIIVLTTMGCVSKEEIAKKHKVVLSHFEKLITQMERNIPEEELKAYHDMKKAMITDNVIEVA